MIIECKVELDWIEDESVDEMIQAKIVKEAVSQVGASITKKVDEMAIEILNTRVNAMIDDIWANFMEKRVNLTDKYGDTVESHDTIKDMLKSRLDDFINQQVDENGKPLVGGRCGYNTMRQIDWLIKKMIVDHTGKFMQTVQRDFDMQLKETLNKALKDTITSSMLKNVDISSLISAAQGVKS